jgi:hypothetical protein
MFLLLQLTGDWLHDNVATPMNKSKFMSIEGKVRVIKYIVKWKEESWCVLGV